MPEPHSSDHDPSDPDSSAPESCGTGSVAAVERMFPHVLRAKILLIGRDALRANKGRLHFVLIATDILPAHREEVLRDLKHYPVVQHYTAAELENFFEFKGAKAIGFTKSSLAQSIYAGLKQYRLNKPPAGPTPPKTATPPNPGDPA
jgi:hypothetical protein